MKLVNILILSFFCVMAFSQTNSQTEHKTVGNTTYEIYRNSNIVIVQNVYDPFPGVTNKEEWQFVYKITNISDIKPILVSCLGEFLKTVQLDEEDEFFSINCLFDLKGNLAYVDFVYPSYLNIPIEIIANLENTLKAELKIKIKPISPSYTEGIYNIYICPSYSLSTIKEMATPVPPTPKEPKWDGDIIIQLSEFAPVHNYHRSQGGNSRYYYPDMFNFTDYSEKEEEGNIYISGIGEAAFSLQFYNNSDKPILIDPSAFRVQLDKNSWTVYPIIEGIYTYNGSNGYFSAGKTVLTPGESIELEFSFNDIICGSDRDKSTYDCKMYLLYNKKNALDYIIDERFDFSFEDDKVNATWYRRGYIMIRYMYNTMEQRRYYNDTTRKYFN